MATILNKKTYVIDAVMSNTLKNTANSLPTGNTPIVLKEIYWYQPASVNDLLTIVDENGDLIKQAKCEANGQSQVFQMYDYSVQDLKVTVLGSGTVYIVRDLA